MFKFVTALSAAIILFGAGAASAAPVTWTLNNVAFNDGGAASGSFVYDDATSTYSAISIVTTVGTIQPGASYDAVRPAFTGASTLYLSGPAGTGAGSPNAFFQWNGPLTSAGGTVAIAPGGFGGSNEGTCGDQTCSAFNAGVRTVIAGGTISGVPVASAPTVTALSPASSDANGGVSVTITGTNFTGATSVTFGGVAATTFTVLSATSITATVPAQSPGVKEVVVTTPQGSNDTAPTTNDFTVTPVVVPTMTEWAMILFGMILAGGAALVVQRRRITG